MCRSLNTSRGAASAPSHGPVCSPCWDGYFGRSADLVMRHVRRYEDVIGLALAGLVGLLVLAYVARAGQRSDDPAVRAFERELDVLSGEYPAVDDDDQRYGTQR